jgi:hypothetical protein
LIAAPVVLEIGRTPWISMQPGRRSDQYWLDFLSLLIIAAIIDGRNEHTLMKGQACFVGT